MTTPMPTLVMRASEVIGRPVVTLGGEFVAGIKDVGFERTGGRIAGFTLRSPELFSRSRKDALPWAGVHGLGRDAVMVAAETVIVPTKELTPRKQARKADVLQDRMLTDTGRDLGRVVDVVLYGRTCMEVVSYEVEASETLGTAGQRVLIPLPDTVAVSGEHLIVPAAATEFVSDDLAGFGAAV